MRYKFDGNPSFGVNEIYIHTFILIGQLSAQRHCSSPYVLVHTHPDVLVSIKIISSIHQASFETLLICTLSNSSKSLSPFDDLHTQQP